MRSPTTSTGIETGATRTKNSTNSQSGLRRDQEILRLADLRRDAAERGADGGMHHEPAQERAERVEVRTMEFVHVHVIATIVLGLVRACRKRSGGTPDRTRRRL